MISQLQAAHAIMAAVNAAMPHQTDPIAMASGRSQTIAKAVVEGMVQQLKMPVAWIWLYDPSDQSMRLAAQAGIPTPADTRLQHVLPDDSPLGQLVRLRPALLTNNLSHEPWVLHPEWLEAQGLVGGAGYPINLGERPLGCLSVLSDHPLEPEFFEVLKLLSAYTASAIAHAHQYQHLQRQSDQAAQLHRIGERLRQAVSVSEVIQTVLDCLSPPLNPVGFAHLQAGQWRTYGTCPAEVLLAIASLPEAATWHSHPLALVVPLVWQEQYQCERLGFLLVPPRLSPDQETVLAAVVMQATVILHRAQLFEHLQQQAERQALLNRMTARMRYSLNLDDVVQATVTEVAAALNASRVSFIFLQPPQRRIVCRHSYAQPGIQPLDNQVFELAEFPLPLDMLNEAISVQPWVDMAAVARLAPEIAVYLGQFNVRSLVDVVLNLGPGSYGILTVHHCAAQTDPPRHWTLSEQELLRSVGEQLVIAINQSRLYERTQQQARREALLNEISSDIRNSLDPSQVLVSIEQSLAATLELEECRIRLDVAALGDAADQLLNGYPLVISQAEYGDLEPRLQALIPRDRSVALMPLIHAGDLMGVIMLVSAAARLNADVLSVGIAVAEQASIALKQAQLYDHARNLARRETRLREVAQRLTGTYPVQDIIQVALAGMANLLEINTCQWVMITPLYQPSATSLAHLPLPETAIAPATQLYSLVYTATGLTPAPLSRDLSWLVLLHCFGKRQPLRSDDTVELPSGAAINGRLLAIPVFVDDQVSGVLLAHQRDCPYDSAEVELIQTLADMTAVAIQRANYYEQARRQEATAATMRGLTEGREAESRRLAADLHDQTLADLGALSRQMQHSLNHGIEPAALTAMNQQLIETIGELRAIVEDLQPTAMRAFNMESALRSLLERAAQRSRSPLVTRFEDRSQGHLRDLDRLSQTTLFRIVQEALTNIVKHANASRVDCSIVYYTEPTAHLEVKIIDDGRGMPPNPQRQGSHGLSNMRYRAELMGASITWRPRRQGSGTVVSLTIPIAPALTLAQPSLH